MSEIRIGAHVLDLGRGLLLRGGEAVHLRARSFALLAYMATRPGHVLDKDTLLDAVWPNLTVTEDSLTQAIRDLRKVLGEGAVRTVARRGYVLQAAAPRNGAAAPPRIAVLPLATLSPDPQDRLIADGLVDELTCGLGRFGLISVVARHSAFQFRPEEVAPDAAARQLGARYFVSGTARRIGPRLVLAVALGSVGGDRELWSETLAFGPDTLSEVAAGLPIRLVARLDIDVRRQVQVAGALTTDLDAFALFTAGVGLIRSYGGDVNERAREFFRRAAERDPGFGLAHAYLGLAEAVIAGYDGAPPDRIGAAMRHVRRALELAPEESRCHWIASVLQYFARDHAAAEMHAARAVAINPSDADLLVFHGFVLALRGDAQAGLAQMRRAEALNPLHPDWYHMSFAVVCQIMGRHEEVAARLGCLPRTNAFRETRLAASLAALGDAAGARAALDRAAALAPGWDPVAEARAWHGAEHARDREAFVALVQGAVALAGGGAGSAR